MSSLYISPQSDRSAVTEDECYVLLHAGALHDLVAPVNQIRWMVDLILKKHGDGLDEDDAALFGFLRSSTERLQILTAGLRTYMRIVGQTQPYMHFDANAILAQALATMRPAIEQNDAMVTQDELPEVYGDPNQICHTLAALIENSIKFRRDQRPEIHVAAEAEENGWLFSVRDNGIGIDPRYRERVFEVFKRVHSGSFPGSGVGLAIAKRIIERHGGRIWLKSDPGSGSTFFFRLPMESRDVVPRIAL